MARNMRSTGWVDGKRTKIYQIGDLTAHDLVVLQEALDFYYDHKGADLDDDKYESLSTLSDIVGDMIGEIGNG